MTQNPKHLVKECFFFGEILNCDQAKFLHLSHVDILRGWLVELSFCVSCGNSLLSKAKIVPDRRLEKCIKIELVGFHSLMGKVPTWQQCFSFVSNEYLTPPPPPFNTL